MHLRALEEKDGPLMLEWMHDPSVVEHLSANFAEKTLEDCLGFIAAAADRSSDLHLAIADEHDTYMGTVSLKHIGQGTAEFAITVRKAAMGKGYAREAMARILAMGLENLSAIYWCVSPRNLRAVRFYDKNGYVRTTCVPKRITDCYDPGQELIWYVYQ